MKESSEYPIYRRSPNGLNWYRIEAMDRFTEVQVIGERSVVHKVLATTYFEKLRIQEMMEMNVGVYSQCSEDDFLRAMNKG